MRAFDFRQLEFGQQLYIGLASLLWLAGFAVQESDDAGDSLRDTLEPASL